MTPRRGALARGAAAFVMAALSLPVHAGRPLTTEDASVLEEKRCQLEAWIDRARDATAGWLVPACNFGSGLEWQVGFARAWSDGRQRLAESYAQAKWLWPLGLQAWSAGTVVGTARRPLNAVARGWENPFVSMPVSYGGEGYSVHVAPGWARDRENRRDVATWGVALEIPSQAGLTWVAEAFGENRARPFVRAGGRWSITADFDVDLTVVTRPGGAREERFVSLGVFWQGARFLP